MGSVAAISKQKEWESSAEGKESDQSVEFDWSGVPTTKDSSGMDGIGIDDGTRAEKEVNEEIRGTKAIERRGSSRMYGNGYGKKCVCQKRAMVGESLPRSSTICRIPSQNATGRKDDDGSGR